MIRWLITLSWFLKEIISPTLYVRFFCTFVTIKSPTATVGSILPDRTMRALLPNSGTIAAAKRIAEAIKSIETPKGASLIKAFIKFIIFYLICHPRPSVIPAKAGIGINSSEDRILDQVENDTIDTSEPCRRTEAKLGAVTPARL